MGGTKAGSGRFEVLDSLRGLCACMVLLAHIDTPGVISQALVVRHAYLFVDFFFVLSGFVIAASYGERIAGGFSILKFALLRLGRIYPLHVAVLAVFLLFELVLATGLVGQGGRAPFAFPHDPGSLVASLLLVHTFVGPDQTVWNDPSWSIAVELWTYLIFAALFRWSGRLIVPVSLALAACCALYLAWVTDRYINVFHDGALARCLFGFSLGVVGFKVHPFLGRHGLGRYLGTALEVLAGLAVVLIVVRAGSTWLSLLVPPTFLAVVLVFAQERGALSWLLRRRPFLFVGMLSYSIYMIHMFLKYRLADVVELLERASGVPLSTAVDDRVLMGSTPLMGDAISILAVAGTIACAYLTYRYIERPAQLWSRNRVARLGPADPVMALERKAPTF